MRIFNRLMYIFVGHLSFLRTFRRKMCATPAFLESRSSPNLHNQPSCVGGLEGRNTFPASNFSMSYLTSLFSCF